MALVYAVKNGNWSDPTVWNTGSLPGNEDDVYTNGKTVTIDIDLIGQYRPKALYARNPGDGTSGGYFIVNTTRQIGEPDYPVDIYGPDLNGAQYPCVRFTAYAPNELTIYGNVFGGPQNYCYGVQNQYTGTVNIIGNVSGLSCAAVGVRNESLGTINIIGDVAGGVCWDSYGASNVGSGTINIIGNVSGGSGNYGGGVLNAGSGIINITGNVNGGSYGTAYGVYNSAGGVVFINSDIRPTTTNQIAVAVYNGSTGHIIINGDVYGGRGSIAVYANNGYIRINGDLRWDETYSNAAAAGSSLNGLIVLNGNIRNHHLATGYYGCMLCVGRVLLYNGENYLTVYAESADGGPAVSGDPIYHDGAARAASNFPGQQHVRYGITYGPDNEYIGTCHVPPPESVAYGVPVDDTVGTAVITPEAIASAVWNALRTDYDEPGTFGAVSEWAGGGGGGTADWTDDEKAQIRHRLGIAGTKQTPTDTPSLATPESVWSYSNRTLTDAVSILMDQSLPTQPTDGTVGEALVNAANNLDTSISSRLASNDSRLNNLDATISSRLSSTDSRLNNLDAAISSRLASSDSRLNYLDASISSRATTSDIWTYSSRTLTEPVTLSMSQTLPTNPTENTVGQALYNSATQLDATISSRLPTSSYTPPDNASISAIKTKTDQLQFDAGKVIAKAEVVTDKTNYSLTTAYDRAKNALMVSEYTAPDNASISAIKTKTDQLQFDTGRVIAKAEIVADKTNYTLTSDYDRAKTALAVSEYTAPDNNSISAIKAKTDQLTFSSGKVLAYITDVVTIDLAQTLPETPQDNTVGKALKESATKLDVAISTRLATEDYIAPDNTSISAIKAKTDQLQFDTNRVIAKAEIVADKSGYSLSSEYDNAKDALTVTEYGQHILDIKGQTDKLQFNSENYVYAVTNGGGGGECSIEVIVPPLAANILETVFSVGGKVVLWKHATIRASWVVSENLGGHDLYWIIYNSRVVPTEPILILGPEYITIHVQEDGSSAILVEAPASLVPDPGTYDWIIKDETPGVNMVLLKGKVEIVDVPPVG